MTRQLLSSPSCARVNGRAIAMMVGAMACFVLNDALVKHVSQFMPSAQLIFVRGLMASALVLLVAHRLAALRHASAVLNPRVALRGAVDACATMMYLLSLFRLPIGNATAINLAAPLFMTVFAVFFLGERAGVAWLGIALLVGSGLYMLHSERGRTRAAALDAQPE